MSEAVDRELADLLDAAERMGSCLPVSDERLRAALSRRMGRDGTVLRPAPGLYVRRESWEAADPAERALALMRGLHQRHPEWVFCGPSAALVYGADVSWGLLRTLHLVAAKGGWRAAPGIARHRLTLDEEKGERPVERLGVRVTPFARTVLDCLRWLEFREALVVADFAVRGRSVPWLASYIRDREGSCHGVGQALAVLAHADGRAESGGESIARAVMIEQGFMLPDLQVWVPDPLHSGRGFRADFVWVRADGRVIVGECDGARKLRDPAMTHGRTPEQVLLDQRSREGLITAYDVSVVRFTYEEAAGVSELVRKLDFYGVPRLDSPLARTDPAPAIDWSSLLRR